MPLVPPPNGDNPAGANLTISASAPVLWQLPEGAPPETVLYCHACAKPIQPGTLVSFVAIGCGDNPVERQRARSGLPFKAVTVPLHWPCVLGDERTVGQRILVP